MTEVSTQSNADDVIQSMAKSLSCDHLSDLLQSARQELPLPEWKKVLVEFSNYAGFLLETDNAFLAKLARRVNRTSKYEKFKADLKSNFTFDGVLQLEGIEIANQSSQRFAFFCRDASEPSNVRFTAFDEFGFSFHISRPSYEELVDEAVSSGFCMITKGMLDRLSSNPKFFSGYQPH